MNTKNIGLMAAATVLASILVAGCGGSSDGTSSTSSGSSGTSVTAPSISTQPTAQTVTAGSAASLSVTATGGGTLTYQWYKGSAAISGATSATYTIASTATTDAGSYYVIVTNSAGSVTSATVTLTVNAATVSAPTIATQPTAQTVTAGSAASLSVAAAGGGTLTYQWYKGSTAISGATSATYTIASTATTDAGNYYVVVTNGAGSVTSATVALTVNAASAQAPTITTQPVSQTVTTGSAVTFAVAASGSGTLSYQWFKGTTAIAGATAASYTIASVATGDAGDYSVTVTSSSGTTKSGSATLTVNSTASTCDSTYINNVMAAITTFQTALGSTLTGSMQYSTASNTTAVLNKYKTQWSNLPGPTRPGIALSQLTTAAQISAFNAMVSAALSTAGYADFQGILAADDYLGYTLNANGYGAENYHVAVVGTPSATGLWTLMLGGHHMAFNLTFNAGCMYPTPHHVGVEPRTTFAANNHYTTSKGTGVYASGNYTVLLDKANAMFGIFSALSSTQLQSAFLTGQTFSDVLIGPVEYNTGSYSTVQAKFTAVAASSTRGVLVSSLTTAQQALVTTAITQFVSDYDTSTANRLLADYKAGYGSTYIAWANSAGSYSSSGPSVASNGAYVRIEGPRVWIELAIQNGVVVSSQTHYHMIYRDKTMDYYNELAN